MFSYDFYVQQTSVENKLPPVRHSLNQCRCCSVSDCIRLSTKLRQKSENDVWLL